MSFGELATHTVDTSRYGEICQWLYHLVCVHSIEAVQYRASRFYLSVGRKTPLASLYGETGWKQPQHVYGYVLHASGVV